LYYPQLVATFTGNLLADTLLYPLETILHRLYLQGTRTIIDNTDTGLEVVPIITRYEGVLDCYTTLVSEEGFAALYKGFGALILQYALHMAILKLTRCLFELMSGDKASSGASRAPPPIQIELNRASEGRPTYSVEARHRREPYKYARDPYTVPDF
jgi:solute carrier family 25 protein 46